ncbi:MAG: tetraacyldisaccharide 4'-kinase, partial [Halioglobus sp.]
GATAKEFPHKVSEHSTVAECGDEALLIYQRTQCPCVVAPSRVAAIQALLAAEDVDLIISDDGLQHYALERDLEIVMYDARSGFGNGFCLPAGPLREPLSRLNQVDFVLGRGLDDSQTGVKYCVDALVNVAGDSLLEATPESIGSEVYAVAGIGRPQMFFESLLGLGFSLEEKTFADHHQYVAADFNRLTDQSNKPIIMTEKDAVKCRHLVGDNAWYLKISAVVPAEVISAVMALLKK